MRLSRLNKFLLFLFFSIFLIILPFSVQLPCSYYLLFFFVLVLFVFAGGTSNEDIILMVVLYAASLSLQLSYSLVGGLLNGTDIYGAYRYGLHVLLTSKWDPNYSSFSYNFVLPVTFLFPILSRVSSITLMNILKTVPNFLFSMIYPLLFYLQTSVTRNKRVSFYSVVFLVVFPFNWYVLPSVVRQEMSMLVLFIALYLVISKRGDLNVSNGIVIYLLVISAVLFHYSTIIIYSLAGFLLLIFWAMLRVLGNKTKTCNRGLERIHRVILQLLVVSIFTFILWYFNWRTFVAKAVVWILIKYVILIRAFLHSSGVSYVSSTGFHSMAFTPMVILTGLILLLIVVVGIKSVFDSYRGGDCAHLEYSLLSLSVLLIPVVGYAGALGVIRVVGMILFVSIFLVGKGLYKLVGKSNIRFFALIALLVLVYSGVLSLYIASATYNPEIVHPNRLSIPKTWATWQEYYGTLFLMAHPEPNMTLMRVPSELITGILLSTSPTINLIGLNLQELSIMDISESNNLIIAFPTDSLRYNILWLGKWTSSGLVYYRVHFESIKRYLISHQNTRLVYSSSGFILVSVG